MPRLVDIDNLNDALQEQDETSPIILYDSYYVVDLSNYYGSDKEIRIVCTAYLQNGKKCISFIIKYNSSSISDKLNSILHDMLVFREPIIRNGLKHYINDYFGGSLWRGGNRFVDIMDELYIDYYTITSIS